MFVISLDTHTPYRWVTSTVAGCKLAAEDAVRDHYARHHCADQGRALTPEAEPRQAADVARIRALTHADCERGCILPVDTNGFELELIISQPRVNIYT